MVIETGQGFLYWRPADAEWPGDQWIPLGTAEESVRMEYPDRDAVINTDGICASISFKADAINPYGYWLLFRRRHPRIARMHRAYRARKR